MHGMLLRVGGEAEELGLELGAAIHGEAGGGVPAGPLLAALVEAALAPGPSGGRLEAARHQAVEGLGAAAVVDAAAVIGLFQMVDRITNGTGVPLDTPIAILSAGDRSALELDRYASSASTPAVSAPRRLLASLVSPLLVRLVRSLRRRSERTAAAAAPGVTDSR